MEERLKNLKKAVNQTAFKKLEFTTEHEQQIRKQLQPFPLKEVLLSMLFEVKSGIELTQLLHVRGTPQIVENEGLIYAILHEAEQQGLLQASWMNEMKYYQLTKLGKKHIEQNSETVKLSMKERILGVRMYAR